MHTAWLSFSLEAAFQLHLQLHAFPLLLNETGQLLAHLSNKLLLQSEALSELRGPYSTRYTFPSCIISTHFNH